MCIELQLALLTTGDDGWRLEARPYGALAGQATDALQRQAALRVAAQSAHARRGQAVRRPARHLAGALTRSPQPAALIAFLSVIAAQMHAY